ncbi:MAG TPA: GspMb/PilO family protein [Humisphaera sp.]|jgi:Tfp pilus assembly protein PilO|nr:GspMb/PilO family protein [Humisphaera sp.]
MALSTRERTITIVVLGACALYVLDQMVAEPYFDKRAAMILARDKRRMKLDADKQILAREANLRRTLAELSAQIKPDAEAAESQLLARLSEFEQEAGLVDPSFQRTRTTDEHGYTNLAYHLSASGGMASLAMFLYRIETAKIPLRVDDIQISPRRDAGDELIVQMNISTLARPENPTDAAVAATGGAK